MIGTVQQIYFLKYLFHLFFPYGRFHAQIYQRKLHIFVYRQFVNQVETLENKSQISLTQSRQLVLVHLIHLFAFEEVRAGSG